MIRGKPLWQQPGFRIAIAMVILVLVSGAVTGVVVSQKAPEQPLEFPHNFHVGAGVPCAYCHAGASTGPVAGLPSINICWGCHQQIRQNSPRLATLAEFGSTGTQIPWVPVFIQPDFVHFNHQPHVTAGLECKTCHGDLSKQTVAEPIPGQNMGWCLDCHQKKAPDNFIRLSDCATCHY